MVESACFACVNPLVQTPVLPPKKEMEVLFVIVSLLILPLTAPLTETMRWPWESLQYVF
jgi:hypothetical protein